MIPKTSRADLTLRKCDMAIQLCGGSLEGDSEGVLETPPNGPTLRESPGVGPPLFSQLLSLVEERSTYVKPGLAAPIFEREQDRGESRLGECALQ